jgi:purine-binding chemotaxis protein CheW
MARQIITFELGNEVFAMDVMAIREIRAWTPATRLPSAPPFIVGVINLRGTVLPVLDLSARMGWQQTEPNERHVVIVVEIDAQLCGMIVDSVSDILSIQETDMQPAPASGRPASETPFLEGVVTSEGRMVMIIDRDALSGNLPTALAA